MEIIRNKVKVSFQIRFTVKIRTTFLPMNIVLNQGFFAVNKWQCYFKNRRWKTLQNVQFFSRKKKYNQFLWIRSHSLPANYKSYLRNFGVDVEKSWMKEITSQDSDLWSMFALKWQLQRERESEGQYVCPWIMGLLMNFKPLNRAFEQVRCNGKLMTFTQEVVSWNLRLNIRLFWDFSDFPKCSRKIRG